MEVCFWGLGSIGQRHLRNLKKVCEEQDLKLSVDAFRSSNTPLSEDIDKLVDKSIYVEKDLKNEYDIIFVTNPTVCHYETLKNYIVKTRSAYIEKPIFINTSQKWWDIPWRPEGTYHVASPLRWHPVIQYIKKYQKNLSAISVRSICSSYLPDWRKDCDYRKNYSAIKKMGGGVALDLIHEWNYLTYLFGFPQKIGFLKGKYSSLEIDSDDLAIYIAQYKDMLAEIHLDYFGRVPKRKIEIYSNNGVFEGDFITNKITNSAGESFILDNTDMYLCEMRDFIKNCLKGTKGDNTPENAWRELGLTEGVVL